MYGQNTINRPKRSIRAAAFAVVLVMVLAIAAPGCSNKAPDGNTPPEAGLTGVGADDYEQLLALIGEQLRAQTGRDFFYKNGMPEMAADGGEQDNAAGGGGERDESFTGTNTQVAGVDEADVVRTDGRHLYVLANNRLAVIDITQPSSMKTIASIRWADYQQTENTYQGESPLEFYLDTDNQTLTILTQSYMYQYDTNPRPDNSGGGSDGDSGGDSGGGEAEVPPDYGEMPPADPDLPTDEDEVSESDVLPENRLKEEEARKLEELARQETEVMESPEDEIKIEPDIWINPIVNEKTFTTIYVYSVADPASPNLIRSWSQDGSYVSSRKIGQSVYVVSQLYQYAVYEMAQGIEMEPAKILPAFSQTGNAADWELLPAEDIRIMPEGDMANQILVSGLNLSNPQADIAIRSVIGSSGAIYASASNLYVAGVRYVWEESTVQQEPAVAEDLPAAVGSDNPVSNEAAEKDQAAAVEKAARSDASLAANADLPVEEPAIMPIIDWMPAESFTDVYRFKLADGNVTENGFGTVPGYLINQFSMDEYNGYLRIATTTGENWMSGDQTSKNNVYVLDSNLKIAGEVTGLAAGETIKSVRFMGDRVWMVTFRTTDPLFGIDLSSPSQPRVLGELKLPGYSSYLHPLSETRMLGFGFDVTVDGDVAYEDGLKVSLFDIENLSDPREIDNLILGERGSWMDLAYQHKSLMVDPANQLYGFPAALSKVEMQNGYSYGRPYFQGLLLIEARQDELVLKGGISQIRGLSDWTLNTKPDAASEALAYGYAAVYRGLRIGDQIFTMSPSAIQANRLADLALIGSVELPGANKYPVEKPVDDIAREG